MGNRPYPAAPAGVDLRENRAELFARYQETHKESPKADTQRARYAPFITKLGFCSRCSKSTLSLGPQ
jgi:hypothetical protein